MSDFGSEGKLSDSVFSWESIENSAERNGGVSSLCYSNSIPASSPFSDFSALEDFFSDGILIVSTDSFSPSANSEKQPLLSAAQSGSSLSYSPSVQVDAPSSSPLGDCLGNEPEDASCTMMQPLLCEKAAVASETMNVASPAPSSVTLFSVPDADGAGSGLCGTPGPSPDAQHFDISLDDEQEADGEYFPAVADEKLPPSDTVSRRERHGSLAPRPTLDDGCDPLLDVRNAQQASRGKSASSPKPLPPMPFQPSRRSAPHQVSLHQAKPQSGTG
jgi:hypothetical protein